MLNYIAIMYTFVITMGTANK